MSDDAKALDAMMAAFRAADEGDLKKAIELHDSILRLEVPPDEKVRAHIFKSYHLLQLGELGKAASEAEAALKLDGAERTGEFEDDSNRGLVLGNLDSQWEERMKAFGREGEPATGVKFGEEKLRLLGHVPGTYMPLTRLWIGRKLAALGDTGGAIEQLRAGLAAEVYGDEEYVRYLRQSASTAEKALKMYAEYSALSAEQAFEAGTEAAVEGNDDMAIRAFTDGLELGMAPELAVHAHIRLALLFAKQQRRKQAVEHGEEALRFDADLGASVLIDPDDELRDVVFAKIEALWGRTANEVERQEGIPSARNYLLERFALVRHLPDNYFPFLRMKIGKYSVQIGDFDTARKHLIDALASEFPDSDDAELAAMYAGVKREAGEWVLRLGHTRSAALPAGSKKSDAEAASETKCWIATAVCGAESVEVAVLRKFRDRYFDTGRKLVVIRLYYRTAPGIAELLRKHLHLRRLFRLLIVTPAYRFAVRWLANPERGA